MAVRYTHPSLEAAEQVEIRVGDEVLIDYPSGDVDRAVVLGTAEAYPQVRVRIDTDLIEGLETWVGSGELTPLEAI